MILANLLCKLKERVSRLLVSTVYVDKDGAFSDLFDLLDEPKGKHHTLIYSDRRMKQNNKNIICYRPSENCVDKIRGLSLTYALVDKEATEREDWEFVRESIIIPSLLDKRGVLLIAG